MPLPSMSVKNCYCAFCRSPRRVYTRKNVGVVNIFASLLGAAILTFGIYREIDPRGILFFVGFVMVTEIFLQVRWRFSVTCRHCGFDPVLYLKDINAAVTKVQRRLDLRKTDPSTFLAEPLKIPKLKRHAIEKETFREEAVRRSKEKKNLLMTLDGKSKNNTANNTALGQLISKQL